MGILHQVEIKKKIDSIFDSRFLSVWLLKSRDHSKTKKDRKNNFHYNIGD